MLWWIEYLCVLALSAAIKASTIFEFDEVITVGSQGEFLDKYGRVLTLRGVNLGANTKLPYKEDGYRVSFVNRPVPVSEAHRHFRRLVSWGCTLLRFLVPWEAIQHAGPDTFDLEYFAYLAEIFQIAGQYGLKIIIDPHQDVWSRHSGGSGAPRWTFEAAGMNVDSFEETMAALQSKTLVREYPRMTWASNYHRAAAATMFTLFFGGKRFAPTRFAYGRPELGNIQQYLQRQFISSYVRLAEYLLNTKPTLLDHVVIGYDSMNEPSPGWIGVQDLRRLPTDGLRLGPIPTPYEAMRLCSGLKTRISNFAMTKFGPQSNIFIGGKLTVDPRGHSCWIDSIDGDLFQNLGIIDRQGQMLKPDYFRLDGQWAEIFWTPFVREFIYTIRRFHRNAILFAEPPVMHHPPKLDDIPRTVYAPHWYDGQTLLVQRFGYMNVDVLAVQRTGTIFRNLVFGRNRILSSFTRQLGVLKQEGLDRMRSPTVVGEIGIPWDFPSSEPTTFATVQNLSLYPQHIAMDASLQALDRNMLSYTLWNYNPDNDGIRKDHWNLEDFSIYTSKYDTGRYLTAVRPYPVRVYGKPVQWKFDPFPIEKPFHFEFVCSQRCVDPHKHYTVLFVPQLHYPVSNVRYSVFEVGGDGDDIFPTKSYSLQRQGNLWYFCIHRQGRYIIAIKNIGKEPFRQNQDSNPLKTIFRCFSNLYGRIVCG